MAFDKVRHFDQMFSHIAFLMVRFVWWSFWLLLCGSMLVGMVFH